METDESKLIKYLCDFIDGLLTEFELTAKLAELSIEVLDQLPSRPILDNNSLKRKILKHKHELEAADDLICIGSHCSSPSGWESPNLDQDLLSMSDEQLFKEIKKLRQGIREHRNAAGHELCWFQPELWLLLPEKTLPKPEIPPEEEFLKQCAIYRKSLEK